jgi:hypothetical protein
MRATALVAARNRPILGNHAGATVASAQAETAVGHAFEQAGLKFGALGKLFVDGQHES